jgi:hypothetical protein
MQVKLQIAPKAISTLAQEYDNLKTGNNEARYTGNFWRRLRYMLWLSRHQQIDVGNKSTWSTRIEPAFITVMLLNCFLFQKRNIRIVCISR